jgi:hypothetical protein
MADKDIIMGRAINLIGMIGVSAGISLTAFAIVLLLFRLFWLRYCKPLSLVLVVGGVDCFEH